LHVSFVFEKEDVGKDKGIKKVKRLSGDVMI